MEDIKSLTKDFDFSYKWKGFVLSFVIVFIFVFLQNLGLKLSLPSVFTNNAQTASNENHIEKIEREIPVVKTGTEVNTPSSQNN